MISLKKEIPQKKIINLENKQSKEEDSSGLKKRHLFISLSLEKIEILWKNHKRNLSRECLIE